MRLRPVAALAEIGVVAALYAAVTMVLNPLSYGPLQLRVAEILKPLVIWEPHLIPAFVIGNFLGNLTSPFSGPWELIFMPTANLVGASLCRLVSRRAPAEGPAPKRIFYSGYHLLFPSPHHPARDRRPGSEGGLVVDPLPYLRPGDLRRGRVFHKVEDSHRAGAP